jgi:enterochelin esterase family protein
MQADSVQQELLGQLLSPEVHADRRVTFRFRSLGARRVTVEGIAGLEAQPMNRGEDDVWQLTVGPLEPEMYSYVFNVDGTIVTDPHNRDVKKWLSLNSMFLVPGDPPLLHEQRPVPHGVVHRHLYSSSTTGTERGVFVYTPPGYFESNERRYPLVVLMHGYGDDESAWLEVGRADMIADNLLAEGKIEPLVLALPYGHPLPIELGKPFDEYADRNVVPMEQDVLGDLLPFLEKQYRVEPKRECRAIVGLSMGGGQSLRIGLGNLKHFAWIGGYSSAAPQGNLDDQLGELASDISATNQQLKLLWIACGQDDFLLERNRHFVDWLKQKGIEHTYRETAGGHDWSVWRKNLAEFLPLLFRSI